MAQDVGLFSAPTILFALGAPLLYYACCDRLFLSYDEYSHWGLMIKRISVYDALVRAGAGAQLLLYNYPPAGAMMPRCAHRSLVIAKASRISAMR